MACKETYGLLCRSLFIIDLRQSLQLYRNTIIDINIFTKINQYIIVCYTTNLYTFRIWLTNVWITVLHQMFKKWFISNSLTVLFYKFNALHCNACTKKFETKGLLYEHHFIVVDRDVKLEVAVWPWQLERVQLLDQLFNCVHTICSNMLYLLTRKNQITKVQQCSTHINHLNLIFFYMFSKFKFVYIINKIR